LSAQRQILTGFICLDSFVEVTLNSFAQAGNLITTKIQEDNSG